jgi:hypothetical protein
MQVQVRISELLKIYVNREIASGWVSICKERYSTTSPRNDANASKVSQALDVSFGDTK